MTSRNRAIQPASSSDESSQSVSDTEQIQRRMEAYDSDGDSSVEKHASQPIQNFDDLPTDESESDEDSDSSDEKDNESESSEDSDDQAEIPLSERVASRALMGRRYSNQDDHIDGKQQRAQRKSKAIELASQRLKDAKTKSKADASNEGPEKEHLSKKSKHAPTEMSSKRRDFYSRKADLNSSGIGVSIGANKYKPRDPRMVSLSGHLDTDLFDKRYAFLDGVSFQSLDGISRFFYYYLQI